MDIFESRFPFLAKTGFLALSKVVFPHEDIAIFTKSADN